MVIPTPITLAPEEYPEASFDFTPLIGVPITRTYPIIEYKQESLPVYSVAYTPEGVPVEYISGYTLSDGEPYVAGYHTVYDMYWVGRFIILIILINLFFLMVLRFMTKRR